MSHVRARGFGKRGLYVSGQALQTGADHARRLVEEHGFDFFVIRTGFDPARPNDDLHGAVELAQRLGARVVLLVGTWWGTGIRPGRAGLFPATPLVRSSPDRSHESQWKTFPPGGEYDEAISETIEHLCARYQPAGVCLTHARFKHAADLAGLFEVAGGAFAAQMAENGVSAEALNEAVRKAANGLARIDAGELNALARNHDTAEFLDALSDGDLFRRWFDFRCRLVTQSVQAIFDAARLSRVDTLFGCNAVGPRFSRLSGQDYEALGRVCDFVQPLLCYMRWHVLQPIFAWADFLRSRCKAIDSHQAQAAAASLFGFDPTALRLDDQKPHEKGEGPADAVINMVVAQLSSLPKADGRPYQPVLNGHDLPRQATQTMSSLATKACDCAVFQGASFAAGDPPGPGWA